MRSLVTNTASGVLGLLRHVFGLFFGRLLRMVDELVLVLLLDAAALLRFGVGKVVSVVTAVLTWPAMFAWALLEVNTAYIAKADIIQVVSFALILGAPAYIVSRTLYKKNSHLIRTVSYGSHSCQKMDIYLPDESCNSESNLPVVIFIQGGGWTLCKREFYPALGHSFRERGFITVIPAYRTFPEVKAMGALDDVRACIKFIIQNIRSYGGNPEKIYLMGQSAGAHLIALAVMKELEEHFTHCHDALISSVAQAVASNPKRSKSSPTICKLSLPSWSFSGIKQVILISGVYDLAQLDQNFCAKGREHLNGLRDIFGGKENYSENSPQIILRRLLDQKKHQLNHLLPSFIFFHGTHDKTCLYSAAQEFYLMLKQVQVSAQFITYQDQSHMESIMEVLEGHGESRLVNDIVRIIRRPSSTNSSPSTSPPSSIGRSSDASAPLDQNNFQVYHDHRSAAERKMDKIVAFAEAELLEVSRMWKLKSYVMRFLCPV